MTRTGIGLSFGAADTHGTTGWIGNGWPDAVCNGA